MCVGVLVKILEENLQVPDGGSRRVVPSTAASPASQETLLQGHAPGRGCSVARGSWQPRLWHLGLCCFQRRVFGAELKDGAVNADDRASVWGPIELCARGGLEPCP